MSINALDHCTVLAQELVPTLEFYRLLGLVPGPRPPLSFEGAWLYAGSKPILHIVLKTTLPPAPQGIWDHVAFRAEGLQQTIDRLRAAAIAYRLRPPSDTRREWQLVCHDPNNAKVELVFDADETVLPGVKPSE